MPRSLTREYALADKFLALADYWRKCAELSNEPWRTNMMCDTAKEFERAAARATGRDVNDIR
jgi:hypothetical protein